MRKLVTLSLMAVGLLATGCSITVPVDATSNPVGSKVGESSGSTFFGMYSTIDVSIKSAAANGGISKISTVDMKRETILGLINTYTCIVTGE